jgi:hypothetical protein
MASGKQLVIVTVRAFAEQRVPQIDKTIDEILRGIEALQNEPLVTDLTEASPTDALVRHFTTNDIAKLQKRLAQLRSAFNKLKSHRVFLCINILAEVAKSLEIVPEETELNTGLPLTTFLDQIVPPESENSDALYAALNRVFLEPTLAMLKRNRHKETVRQYVHFLPTHPISQPYLNLFNDRTGDLEPSYALEGESPREISFAQAALATRKEQKARVANENHFMTQFYGLCSACDHSGNASKVYRVNDKGCTTQ